MGWWRSGELGVVMGGVGVAVQGGAVLGGIVGGYGGGGACGC